MKNKLLLAGILVLAMAIVFKAGMVLGLVNTPMSINEVCMTNGGLLMYRDFCPSGSEKIPVGGTVIVGENGGGSVIPVLGEIAFVDNYNVLKKDGTVWYFYESYESDPPILEWREDLSMKITVANVNDIIQWNSKYFITSTGILYRYGSESSNWELMSSF